MLILFVQKLAKLNCSVPSVQFTGNMIVKEFSSFDTNCWLQTNNGYRHQVTAQCHMTNGNQVQLILLSISRDIDCRTLLSVNTRCRYRLDTTIWHGIYHNLNHWRTSKWIAPCYHDRSEWVPGYAGIDRNCQYVTKSWRLMLLDDI